MNREDFILELRRSLAGKMSAGEIDEHVRYYEQYMNEQMSKGMSEEQILSSLGSARLIAKTLTSSGKKQDTIYEEQSNQETGREREMNRKFRFPTGLVSFFVVFAAVLLIIIVIGLVFAAIWYLLPIIIILFLIGFVIKFFRR